MHDQKVSINGSNHFCERVVVILYFVYLLKVSFIKINLSLNWLIIFVILGRASLQAFHLLVREYGLIETNLSNNGHMVWPDIQVLGQLSDWIIMSIMGGECVI